MRYRHSLETLYWLSHIAFWSDWGKQGPITRVFRRALDSQRRAQSRIVTALDDIGNRILPKSIVVYSRKPLGAAAAAAPETNGHATDAAAAIEDDRSAVEVRAVPAPFAIDPRRAARRREPHAPPLSLDDELRIALKLSGDAAEAPPDRDPAVVPLRADARGAGPRPASRRRRRGRRTAAR